MWPALEKLLGAFKDLHSATQGNVDELVESHLSGLSLEEKNEQLLELAKALRPLQDPQHHHLIFCIYRKGDRQVKSFLTNNTFWRRSLGKVIQLEMPKPKTAALASLKKIWQEDSHYGVPSRYWTALEGNTGLQRIYQTFCNKALRANLRKTDIWNEDQTGLMDRACATFNMLSPSALTQATNELNARRDSAVSGQEQEGDGESVYIGASLVESTEAAEAAPLALPTTATEEQDHVGRPPVSYPATLPTPGESDASRAEALSTDQVTGALVDRRSSGSASGDYGPSGSGSAVGFEDSYQDDDEWDVLATPVSERGRHAREKSLLDQPVVGYDSMLHRPTRLSTTTGAAGTRSRFSTPSSSGPTACGGRHRSLSQLSGKRTLSTRMMEEPVDEGKPSKRLKNDGVSSLTPVDPAPEEDHATGTDCGHGRLGDESAGDEFTVAPQVGHQRALEPPPVETVTEQPSVEDLAAAENPPHTPTPPTPAPETDGPDIVDVVDTQRLHTPKVQCTTREGGKEETSMENGAPAEPVGDAAGTSTSHIGRGEEGTTDGARSPTPTPLLIRDEGDAALEQAARSVQGANWLNDTAIETVLHFIESERVQVLPLRRPRDERAERSGRQLFRPLTQIVIMPFCQDAHWSLALLDLRADILHLYDSLYEHGSAAAERRQREILDILAIFRRRGQLQLASSTPKVVHERSPYQSNGHDCGVYVCLNAMQWVCQLDDIPTGTDVTLWRRIFHALIRPDEPSHDSLGLGDSSDACEPMPGEHWPVALPEVRARSLVLRRVVRLLDGVFEYNSALLRDRLSRQEGLQQEIEDLAVALSKGRHLPYTPDGEGRGGGVSGTTGLCRPLCDEERRMEESHLKLAGRSPIINDSRTRVHRLRLPTSLVRGALAKCEEAAEKRRKQQVVEGYQAIGKLNKESMTLCGLVSTLAAKIDEAGKNSQPQLKEFYRTQMEETEKELVQVLDQISATNAEMSRCRRAGGEA